MMEIGTMVMGVTKIVPHRNFIGAKMEVIQGLQFVTILVRRQT
jgi:hypothetical protein